MNKSDHHQGEQLEVGRTIAASVINQDGGSIHAAEAQVAVEWQVGDVILDLYEVRHIHEAGAMGLVYRVHHRGWDLELAVKSPRSEFFQTPAHRDNFTRECETWINLGLHPHIVSCHYVRTLGGIPRVFAEYVEGGSLKEWIDSRKLYEGGPEESLQRILDIAIQMAWGLHFAHEQGVIHQDVKPANVLLTPDGTAKITDFGLAKARAAAGEWVVTGGERSILVSSGGMTPAYCSPEQANKQPLSRKTDIWSWAVSMLEMFTGEVCWASGGVASEVLAHLAELRAADIELPDLPAELRDLLRDCFEVDPASRPKDAAEVGGRLVEVYRSVVRDDYARQQPAAVELRADGMNNRAVSLLDLGKEDVALRMFEEALAVEPSHLECVYNRGLLLWRRNKLHSQALILALKDAASMGGEDKGAWADHATGLIFLERGDGAAALKAFERLGSNHRSLVTEVQWAWARGLAEGSRSFERHTSAVTSVAFSSDNRWALSGSTDESVWRWEVATGRYHRAFDAACEGRGWRPVVLSSDGRWALLGGGSDPLSLWKVAHVKCSWWASLWEEHCVRGFSGQPAWVSSVALSSNGRWVLSGSDRLWAGTHINVLLWEAATGRRVRTFTGHTDSVVAVGISSDGRWVLSGSLDQTVRLWEAATGRCARIFEGHTSEVTSVALSSNGRWVLLGGVDQTVRLWEAATGRCLRVFEGHTDSVTSVAMSSDGRWVLSGSADNSVRLWEAATGRCLRVFEGHTDSVTSVAMSSDGRWVLSGSADKTVRLWGMYHPLSPLYLLNHWALVKPVSSIEQLNQRNRYEACLRRSLACLDRSEWQQAVKAARKAITYDGYDQALEALDLLHQASLHGVRGGFSNGFCRAVFSGHTDNVTSVTLSSDGRWALSGAGDKTVRLWEVATGRCVRTFEGHTEKVNSVALSSDGRWALSGGWDKTARLWEVATGRCVRIFEGHTGWVTSVALSSDGRWALSGSWDKTVRLWEAATGSCVRTFEGHTGRVSSIALSSDGRWVLSGSDSLYGATHKNVRLWEVATGRSRILGRIFKRHAREVNSVAFSSDGRWALSGSADTTVRCWEVATGQSRILGRSRILRVIFKSHTDQVNSVAFSSDGRWALSGSADKTVRLWEVATARCVRILEGHTDNVTSVALSSDGRWAASGSNDNTVRLWELIWECDFPDPSSWDEAARPYLEVFLTLHCQVGKDGFTRVGKPEWTEEDYQKLLIDLQHRGYGWLRPEGVRRQLEQMTAESKGCHRHLGKVKCNL